MYVVAHVYADLAAPAGGGGAGAMLRATIFSGKVLEEGLREWDGGRRGRPNCRPSSSTSLSILEK